MYNTELTSILSVGSLVDAVYGEFLDPGIGGHVLHVLAMLANSLKYIANYGGILSGALHDVVT